MKALILSVLVYTLLIGQTTVQYVADLAWQDTKNPATGVTYNVYRSDGVCNVAGQVFRKIASVQTKAYADTTIVPGTYCYQITSTINSTESAASAQVLGILAPFPPEGITIVIRPVSTTVK